MRGEPAVVRPLGQGRQLPGRHLPGLRVAAGQSAAGRPVVLVPGVGRRSAASGRDLRPPRRRLPGGLANRAGLAGGGQRRAAGWLGDR